MTEHDAVPRILAALGLVGAALIHILQLPDVLSEEGYLGALFIASVVAASRSAATLARTDDSRAWAGAGGLAGLILLGYLISRTVGLPGFTVDIGVWDEPLGLASMVAEGLVVFVSAGVLLSRAQAREPIVGVVVAEATAYPAGGARHQAQH
jgi:hypothetical protein